MLLAAALALAAFVVPTAAVGLAAFVGSTTAAELAPREAGLAARETELAPRGAELAAHEAELAPPEAELAAREEDAPLPPAPDEQVFFAPRLGGDFHESRCQCYADDGGVRCTCESPDADIESLAPYSGLRVQNAGTRDGRYIAAYFDVPPQGTPDACESCTIVGWTCRVK
jgi:hypothetical protein